jgi:hypothetical protein
MAIRGSSVVKHKAADPEIKGSNPTASKEQEKKEKKDRNTLDSVVAFQQLECQNANKNAPFCSGQNIFVFVIKFIEFF